MKRGKYFLNGVVGSVLLLTPFLAGCPAAWLLGGAAVGVGVYAHTTGELERTYEADLETAWQSVVQAIESMEFPVDSSLKDELGGEIKCHRANGTPVVVKLRFTPPKNTLISVRVGNFGDKALSEVIHINIEKKLRGGK